MGNKHRNKHKSMGQVRREKELEERIRRELELERMAQRPPWTPFQKGYLLSEGLADAYGERASRTEIYLNSRYQVYKAPFKLTFADGTIKEGIELSIKNLDKTAEWDWRDMQRIKNELCGPEFEGCQLFPAESRLVDTANQYYMFVLPEGERFPFGFQDRLVMDDHGPDGARQRPFEPGTRPADCNVIPAHLLEKAS